MKHKFNSQEGQLAGLRSAESKRLKRELRADLPGAVRKVYENALLNGTPREKQWAADALSRLHPEWFRDEQDFEPDPYMDAGVALLPPLDVSASDPDAGGKLAMLRGAPDAEHTAPAINPLTGEHDKWCRCRDCMRGAVAEQKAESAIGAS